MRYASRGRVGNLKSYLVLVSQGRVHVPDITVRHEDTADLQEGHRSKFDKYTPLLDILECQLNIDRGRILPIVFVTRQHAESYI